MATKIPKKLHRDAIVEALCEVRFESAEIPEIVIGRLSEQWSSFEKHRLPFGDIPLPVRAADENLKYAPTLEMKSSDGHVIRIGSSVCSYHVLNVYCGWDVLKERLEQFVHVIFNTLPQVVVTRLGFRYINALRKGSHRISSLSALNLDLRVAGTNISEPFNLNFSVRNDDDHITMTRIASSELVRGNFPKDMVGAVDIDVTTPKEFALLNAGQAFEWIKKAHAYEGEAFFKLFPSDILNEIVEIWE